MLPNTQSALSFKAVPIPVPIRRKRSLFLRDTRSSLGQRTTSKAGIHAACSDYGPSTFNQLVAGSDPARPTI